jgi:hypothetical protein
MTINLHYILRYHVNMPMILNIVIMVVCTLVYDASIALSNNIPSHYNKAQLISNITSLSNINIITSPEPYVVIIKPSGSSIRLDNIVLNGILQLIIPKGHNVDSIKITRVRGKGAIEIIGEQSSINNLSFKDINISRMTINIDKIHMICQGIGEYKISNTFNVNINTIDKIELGPKFTADTFNLSIHNFAEHIILNGFSGSNLNISGDQDSKTDNKKPTINFCELSLSESGIKNKNTQISIESIILGRLLKINAYDVSSNVYNDEYSILLNNITLNGQLKSLINIDLDHINVGDMHLIDVTSNKIYNSEVKIQQTKNNNINSTLAVSGISDIDKLDIEWGNQSLKTLIVKDIKTRELKLNIQFPNEIDTIQLGGLDILSEINAPKSLLLNLAENNKPDRPIDYYHFYDLIERYAYYKTESGQIERPGLEALSKARLHKLYERNWFEICFGMLIFCLTGYGINLYLPICAWVVIYLAFTGRYYCLNRRNQTNNKIKYLLWKTCLFSIKASFSFGIIPTKAHLPLSKNNKDSVKLIKLTHYQGVMTLMQITLCTIYFSQTTLR